MGGFDPPSDLTWATLWQLSDREPWAVVARHGTALHVRVSDCAHFRLTSSSVQILPAPGVRASTIRHLLLDQLLPLLLARDGHLVLHASGVRIAAGAIAIAGAAGAGKSTLAAALNAEGWTVTSDDGVLVEEGAVPLAVPAYPGLRLWPEALDVTGLRERCVGEVAEYSAKCRVAPPPREPEGAAPLRHVYVLERGVRPSIATLAARDASVAVFSHAYRADLTDRGALAAQLEACARFVERVPVSRLTVPHDLSQLRATARVLSAHATVATS